MTRHQSAVLNTLMGCHLSTDLKGPKHDTDNQTVVGAWVRPTFMQANASSQKISYPQQHQLVIGTIKTIKIYRYSQSDQVSSTCSYFLNTKAW